MKKLFAVSLAVLMIAAALVGCSGDKKEEASTTAAVAVSTEAATVSTVVTDSVSEETTNDTSDTVNTQTGTDTELTLSEEDLETMFDSFSGVELPIIPLNP